MKFNISLDNKNYQISLVTTELEMNYLLFYKDTKDINSVYKLMVDIEPQPQREFNLWEKMYILLIQRINSQGQYIEYETVCSKCETVNSHVIDLEQETDFYSKSEIIEDSGIKIEIQFGIPKSATYKNNAISVEEALDNINIKNRAYIGKLAKKRYLNITSEQRCFSCGEEMHYNLNTDDDFLDIVSNANIQNIYQTSHDLQYSGHLSLGDFKKLLSFERELYVSMLNKSIEEKNKNNGR